MALGGSFVLVMFIVVLSILSLVSSRIIVFDRITSKLEVLERTFLTGVTGIELFSSSTFASSFPAPSPSGQSFRPTSSPPAPPPPSLPFLISSSPPPRPRSLLTFSPYGPPPGSPSLLPRRLLRLSPRELPAPPHLSPPAWQLLPQQEFSAVQPGSCFPCAPLHWRGGALAA